MRVCLYPYGLEGLWLHYLIKFYHLATLCRETEGLVAELIKAGKFRGDNVSYAIVSEQVMVTFLQNLFKLFYFSSLVW